MAFDAIKLLLDHFYRHIHIVQMTLLVSFILPRIGVKDFVVIEVFDWKQRQYVRRDCGCRVQDLLPLSGSAWNSSLNIYEPQVPNFVAQGIGDEIILLTLQILIRRITRRLCITIITAFQILRRQ